MFDILQDNCVCEEDKKQQQITDTDGNNFGFMVCELFKISREDLLKENVFYGAR